MRNSPPYSRNEIFYQSFLGKISPKPEINQAVPCGWPLQGHSRGHHHTTSPGHPSASFTSKPYTDVVAASHGQRQGLVGRRRRRRPWRPRQGYLARAVPGIRGVRAQDRAGRRERAPPVPPPPVPRRPDPGAADGNAGSRTRAAALVLPPDRRAAAAAVRATARAAPRAAYRSVPPARSLNSAFETLWSCHLGFLRGCS